MQCLKRDKHPIPCPHFMDKHRTARVKLMMQIDRMLFWMARAALDKLSAPKRWQTRMSGWKEDKSSSESLMRDLQKPGLEQSREVRWMLESMLLFRKQTPENKQCNNKSPLQERNALERNCRRETSLKHYRSLPYLHKIWGKFILHAECQ